MMPPIVLFIGVPAVGKSTLSCAFMARYERGIHIEVDELRLWVKSGHAAPIGWTEETTRQFRLAEEAAADMAIRYQDAGFAVAIDHCTHLPALDDLVERRFAGRPCFKVLVQTDLETNLERNRSRENKDFDPEILVPTIENLHTEFEKDARTAIGWILFDNAPNGLVEAVERLAALIEEHR